MRAWLRHRPGWVLSTLLVLAGWSAPSARASELRLEAVTVESSAIVVDVLASDLHDAGSFDLIVRFDPERLAAPTRERGVLARHGMALDHTAEPGSYRLAVLVPSGVSGEGQLARLRFPVQAASGSVDLELEALASAARLRDGAAFRRRLVLVRLHDPRLQRTARLLHSIKV